MSEDLVEYGRNSYNPREWREMTVVPKEVLEELREDAHSVRHEPTHRDKVKIREGKAGQKWKYITRFTAMEWLDKHYPKLWTFECLGDYKEFAGYLHVRGKVTIWDPATQLKREVICTGSEEIRFINATGLPQLAEYYKSAETDSLKRCVYTLGGFGDIYTKETDFTEDVRTLREIAQFIRESLPILIERMESKIINPMQLFSTFHNYIYKQLSDAELEKACLTKKI